MRFFNHYQRARLLLLTGCIACYLVFWIGGKVCGVPPFRGYGGSILTQRASILGLIGVLVMLVGSVLLGTLIAGTIRFDAGLFTATAGMIALSWRSADSSDVLRQWADSAHGPGVFILFALELVLLYALIILAWNVLWMLHRSGWLKPDSFRDGIDQAEMPPDGNQRESAIAELRKARWSALAMQCIAMAIVMLLFCQTGAKKQVLVSVLIASFAGTAIAYSMFSVQPSIWYWSGPLVVGVIGYIWAYFSPGDWQIGVLHQPLAHPLPLDYASAGPAGAILGYWMSRRWQRDQEAEQAAEQAAQGV